MKKFVFLAALLAATPASADLLLTGVGGPPLRNLAPADIATYSVWGGLYGYSAAQCNGTTLALRVRRTSDNAVANLPITTSCVVDMTAAAAHCGVGGSDPCFVTEVCNQAGASDCTATHDLLQATVANQPAFIFDCEGRPCIRAGATDVLTSGTNMTPATGVVSMTFTGAKTGAGACTTLRQNLTNNRMTINTSGGPSMTGGTSGTITNAAVADGTFVSTVGVMNGANSYIYSGGVTVSGTVVGNTTAAAPSALAIGTSTTCSMLSFGIIDNVALTAAQAATLVNIARIRGGF